MNSEIDALDWYKINPNESQCRFRSKMNSECSICVSYQEGKPKVSMPLPQQDEFGEFDKSPDEDNNALSQCRFRSKMNSEPTTGELVLYKNKEVSMPLPQQDEFGDHNSIIMKEIQDLVSMPLPQQDEFGDCAS